MQKSVLSHVAVLVLHVLIHAAAAVAVAQPARSPALEPPGQAVFEVVRQFYDYDQSVPLHAEVVNRQEFPTFTREKIVFTGVQHSRVPAYLALPKEGTGPFPVVILIDGITGSKERWFQEDSWPRGLLVTNALVQSGMAVLALDARYHGERARENDYRIPFDPVGLRDMVVLSVQDHRRAMDYLSTRPDIDTTRIGALGLSMGGMMTFTLSSLDPRIKAAIAGVTPVGRAPMHLSITPQTFAPAISETPFLMLMGQTDPYYSVEEAQQLYDVVASPRKDLVFYEVAHRLPEAYVDRSVAWFEEYLK